MTTTTSNETTSRVIRRAIRSAAVLIFRDGTGYTDRIGIHAGETQADGIARRFGNAGLPAGWTVDVVLCKA